MPQTTETTRDPKSEGLRFISARRQLAHTIRSSLLGVLPMDQEIQLEDRDWRLILVALEANMQNPAPSCDAPHCDCADGEDCRANVAAKVVTSAYLHRDGTMTPLRDSGDDFLAFLTSPCEPVAPVPSDARMARIVQVYDTDEDAMGRTVLIIDHALEGHGDPFHPGDLVVQVSGGMGIQEVVDIQIRKHATTLIGLVVKPVRGTLFDAEAF